MKKALVPFLTAGYPDNRTFIQAIKVAGDEGADLIEIGLPFSDPVADGKVIQMTSESAIQAGMNRDKLFQISGKLSKTVPLVLMSYANPLATLGFGGAFSKLKGAGFSGCIIPDMPAEELSGIIKDVPRGFFLVPMAAPTTTPERLKVINSVAKAFNYSGFTYLVSLRGTTGSATKAAAASEVGVLYKSLNKISGGKSKTYIGFGIKNAADARRYGRISDGVIVGAALMHSLTKGIRKFASHIRSLRNGLDLEG